MVTHADAFHKSFDFISLEIIKLFSSELFADYFFFVVRPEFTQHNSVDRSL